MLESRCSKSKGFAQKWFVWYWYVHIFRPRRVAIYVSGKNPTPSRSRHCLLASKDIKIEKDSRRSLRPSNWLLTRYQSWTDPPPPYFLSGIFLWIPPSSCPSADPLVCHRPIALTCWPTVRAEPFWPSADPINCSVVPSIGRLHSAASLYPFWPVFFQKNGVNTFSPVSE
jgi:hypothetical protein